MQEWRTGDPLRDEIRADMLRELGWPIVEESDIGRGEKEGVAMEVQRVHEIGQRLTDARNKLMVGGSMLVLPTFDRARMREHVGVAMNQVEKCLKLLREEGFQVEVPCGAEDAITS